MRRDYNGIFIPSAYDSFLGDNLLLNRLLIPGSPVRDEYISIFKDEITNNPGPDPFNCIS